MDKRNQTGSQLRSQPSHETSTGSSTWSHDSSSLQASRPSINKASTDSLTASSTAPSTPSSLHQIQPRGSSSTHAYASSKSQDDESRRVSISSAASADPDSVEYFPAEDSSDGSGPETVKTLKRTSTVTHQSSNRLVRYLSRKLGRTFNKKAGFRGKAFLPNDQIERERNILQHQLFLEVLDGKLFLCPARPRRVLDIGTGPGLWPLQMAQKFPDAQILGIDVDPVKPPYMLPNCRFDLVDASQPWSFDQNFDFIHMRMVGELPNGKNKLFETMYEHLMPGGWIEITEWLVKFQSGNRSLNMFNIWNKNFKRGLRKFGSSPYWALGWKSIMQDKGCLHVTERRHPVPLNPWAPGKRLQKQGKMMAENVQTFLEGATMPIFTGALGWTHEQVQELLSALKKEVADTDVHGYLTLMTVWCQKPREGSSISSSARTTRSVSTQGTV